MGKSLSFLFLVSCLFLSACTISQKKQFEKVQVGMDKDQVLGLLESPQRTQRWHGMDRWTYIFYDENQRLEKEIHFDQGTAKYVGDLYQPAVSAEEQDKANEDSNQQLEALYQSQRGERARLFPQYEQSIHGTDTIRYVPTFEPVQ